MKIMVVDDSSTMRKLVIRAVGTAGYRDAEFIEAAGGSEALEQLDKHEVELILCDVNMPAMNGIELVRQIRSQRAIEASNVGGKELIKRVVNTVPIIMLTTETGLDMIREAMDAGANDYVNKPFTPDDLREKIAQVIG